MELHVDDLTARASKRLENILGHAGWQVPDVGRAPVSVVLLEEAALTGVGVGSDSLPGECLWIVDLDAKGRVVCKRLKHRSSWCTQDENNGNSLVGGRVAGRTS